MAGPGRITPGVSTPGEDAQPSEAGEPLAWQSELDVAIADIDSRLKHPRRRVTDEPPAPQNIQPAITSEMIDEIAWRVADLLKRDGSSPVEGTAMAAAISKTVAAPRPRAPEPPAPPPPEPKRLPHGIAMTIRVRKPFFRLPWPFRRRRRQAMIMFSDYRIS
jgi:hypothetical protein